MDWNVWGPLVAASVGVPMIAGGLSLREQFKAHDARDDERFAAIGQRLDELKQGQDEHGKLPLQIVASLPKRRSKD